MLVTGPVNQPTPPGVERIDVESARDMERAVLVRIDGVDIFIGAAAVSDYQRAEPAPQKLKKTKERFVLELEPAPDVIAAVTARRPRPFTVGFAAETESLEQHARTKLERKSLDMIAANRVGPGLAFDCEDNALLVLWPGGRAELQRAPKVELARALVRLIAQQVAAREAAA